MRRGAAQSVLGNPVLIGAVTVLVTIVAVYLAYNANSGLPFVPTYQLNVRVPNGHKLVEGNDVREGGFRIGVVEKIDPARGPEGVAAAVLRLKLDKSAGPIPADSTVRIRPRSALGLKYVEVTRGRSRSLLQNGSTITAGTGALTPELEDFFSIFERATREDSQANLMIFGGAFTARGAVLNHSIDRLPRFLDVLGPVAANLSHPDTALGFFLRELSDGARIAAPVSDSLAAGFTSGAQVFEAFSRHPDRLAQTIERSPRTLEVGITSLRAQRPFLRHLAGVSAELRGTARQLRTSVPEINSALATGTVVLPRTPELNQRLGSALETLEDVTDTPSTNLSLRALNDTVSTLNPTLRYLGPFVTVCNYWNYWWTFLSDHLTDQDRSGQVQRVQGKTAPIQEDSLTTFGADEFANGEGYIGPPALGDPVELHAQQYGRAVEPSGRADCESGQRGYPERLARHADEDFDVALEARTPGAQGPTYEGRSSVPDRQTYDAEPDSRVEIER